MRGITSFEWKESFKNVPVGTFKSDERPSWNLFITSLSVFVVDNHGGFIDVEFAFGILETDHGVCGRCYSTEVAEFIDRLSREVQFDSTFVGDQERCRFRIKPVPGQPLTETLMRKVLRFFAFCGLRAAAPRIVTETFAGKDDIVPYGEYLMEKCLRNQIATS